MSVRRYPDFWQHNNGLARALSPLSALFELAARRRRQYYQANPSRTPALSAPVIVIGNLSVGGTGKTPLVNWLVGFAQELGFTPGVVLRGYGGSAVGPQRVNGDDSAEQVGDEALLIARHTGVAVAIGRDRPAAAAQLINQAGVDLVISDDGLQHYRLVRDVEVVVIDAERGLGNRRCLPAGPLREGPNRLTEVDWVICNGTQSTECQGQFRLKPGPLRAVGSTPENINPPQPGDSVVALAGIGHPERFFATLDALGFHLEERPRPDHHHFRASDFAYLSGRAIVMTEKDAVKCAAIAPANCWQLPVVAEPDPATATQLRALLQTAAERFARRSASA